MKRKIRCLFLILFVSALCFTFDNVYAVSPNQGVTGGGGGGAGASAGTGLGGCGSWMNGYAYSQAVGGQMAVRATMEWRDGDTIKIIGSPIYIYRSGTDVGGGSDKIRDDSWFNDYSVNYEQIYRDLVGGSKQSNKDNLNYYLRAMGLSKGINDSAVKKYAGKSCKIKGKNRDNCAGKAGLRFVVENVIFTANCGSSYYPARSLPDTGYFVTFAWDKMLNGAASDTNIVHDSSCNGSNTRDPYHSCGLNYYDVTDSIKSYNYYIDSACTNCDWDGKAGSYHIQDVTNWNAILASKDSENKTVKAYYKQATGCGNLYCREEYKVTFPNKADGVEAEKLFNVETGRFFTVNKLERIGNGIYNFGPIEIHKIKQCISPDNNTSCLNNYINGENSLGDFGTVKISYKEKKGEGRYNTSELKLDVDTSAERKMVKKVSSSVVSTDDGNRTVVTAEGIQSYVLPENTFRYFELGSGTATTNKKPRVDYKDEGTATLPISNGNFVGKRESSSSAGGTVTLHYSLPKNSKIAKAFDNPTYFQNQKDTKNIYKKYISGEVTEAEDKNDLKNSSCAKIYESTTSSNFKQCAKDNATDTTRKCRTAIKDYSCQFNVCKEGEVVGANGKCGGDCSTGKCLCRIEGGKYYNQNGREISKAAYEKDCTCKVLGLGQYLGKDGNLLTNYYEYLRQCPSSCPPEVQNECTYTINGDRCARCPSGACPMPGGVCPYGGGDVIYRPIDLVNPFPSQSGGGRQTGDNWCYYDLQNNKLDCGGGNGSDTTNKVVQSQIKKNRGVSSYSVYGMDPMYEINLDTNDIRKLRNINYNYDDWSHIKCNSSTGCRSEFLRGTIGIDGGVCASNPKGCEKGRGES